MFRAWWRQIISELSELQLDIRLCRFSWAVSVSGPSSISSSISHFLFPFIVFSDIRTDSVLLFWWSFFPLKWVMAWDVCIPMLTTSSCAEFVKVSSSMCSATASDFGLFKIIDSINFSTSSPLTVVLFCFSLPLCHCFSYATSAVLYSSSFSVSFASFSSIFAYNASTFFIISKLSPFFSTSWADKVSLYAPSLISSDIISIIFDL